MNIYNLTRLHVTILISLKSQFFYDQSFCLYYRKKLKAESQLDTCPVTCMLHIVKSVEFSTIQSFSLFYNEHQSNIHSDLPAWERNLRPVPYIDRVSSGI